MAEQLFQVTYFNAVLDKQCVLIDKVDSMTAVAVLAKFGDKRDPMHYMGPQTRIEPMPVTEDA